MKGTPESDMVKCTPEIDKIKYWKVFKGTLLYDLDDHGRNKIMRNIYLHILTTGMLDTVFDILDQIISKSKLAAWYIALLAQCSTNVIRLFWPGYCSSENMWLAEHETDMCGHYSTFITRHMSLLQIVTVSFQISKIPMAKMYRYIFVSFWFHGNSKSCNTEKHFSVFLFFIHVL